ncbi:MAG TPA: hypothetical protein VI756_14000 [Blastocatellia bacterium]
MAGLRRVTRFGWGIVSSWPAFTALGILALSFGTGANTTIFKLIDTFLLQPILR